MTQEKLQEIEQAYQEASAGTGIPKYILYRCEKCNRGFEFPSDIPCEHLKELLRASSLEEMSRDEISRLFFCYPR